MRFNVGDDPDDYFRVRSGPLDPPKPGHVLITRVPYTDIVKILHPGGKIETTIWEGSHANHIWIRRQGVPKDRIDPVINYVWSFLRAYVAVSQADPVATNVD